MSETTHDPSATAVVWFRRDLRLHDHPALTDALATAERVAPLFVFDERLLQGRWPAPNRVWFMRESVAQLAKVLEAHGSRLHLRIGRPELVVPAFAAEVGASRVLASRDYGPYARRRDQEVDDALRSMRATLGLRRGLLVHEPEDIVTASGGNYRVFSPYRRAWDASPRRAVLSIPHGLERTTMVERGGSPSLAALGLRQPTASLPTPGSVRWAGCTTGRE